jgi:hypothetical protein
VIIGDQDSQHAEVARVRLTPASGPRAHFLNSSESYLKLLAPHSREKPLGRQSVLIRDALDSTKYPLAPELKVLRELADKLRGDENPKARHAGCNHGAAGKKNKHRNSCRAVCPDLPKVLMRGRR